MKDIKYDLGFKDGSLAGYQVAQGELAEKVRLLEKDALRYRWLRDSDNFAMDEVPDGSIWDELCEKDRSDFDDFIDFMMANDAAPKPKSEGG